MTLKLLLEIIIITIVISSVIIMFLELAKQEDEDVMPDIL